MDTRRRHRRLLLAGALSALGVQATGAPAPAAAVNDASRLAMLAERLGKLHAQIGRDILAARSRRALGESAAEFERLLRETSGAAASGEMRENARLLRLLWDEYRPLALRAPTPEGGRKLAERAEELDWIATKGARLLQERSGTRAGALVLAAGGARAAAQRLGRIYLQRGWALAATSGAREIRAAEQDVTGALEFLKGALESGEEAASSLRMAESQLAFLRQAVDRHNLEHIAKTTDYVAEAMDQLARGYAEAS
jgi:hypothetical protein